MPTHPNEDYMQYSFDLFDAEPVDPPIPAEASISASQIQRIREAFDSASIFGMEERRDLIQGCTMRSVSRIQELLVKDVRPILSGIEARTAAKGGVNTGSAWDNREGDTWIDKL